jgi:hypothetical protein
MLFDPLPEVGDGFGSEYGDGVPGGSPKYVPVRMLMAWTKLGRRHGSNIFFLSPFGAGQPASRFRVEAVE